MKKVKLLMTGIFLAFMVMSAKAQEINWQHVVNGQEDWDELLKSAKGKTIFIDVYTDWCGYCKMMDRDVFSISDVSKYFNKNYINIKIDGETAFGGEFVKKHGIKGFPHYLYMNSQSHVLNTISGYVNEKTLMEECNEAKLKAGEYKKYSKVKSIDKLEGVDKANYLLYLKAVDADKASKLANELMETFTSTEFLSKSYTDFFTTFSDDYNNKLIQFLNQSNNGMTFGETHGFSNLQIIVENTFEKYFEIAIDNKDKPLMDKVANNLIPCFIYEEDEVTHMKFIVDKSYYAGIDNAQMYYETILEYKKANEVAEDFWLTEAEEIIKDHGSELEILAIGNTLLDKAIAEKKTSMAYLMKSYIYYLLEKNDKSLECLNESLKHSPTEEETQTINELKQLIEAKN